MVLTHVLLWGATRVSLGAVIFVPLFVLGVVCFAPLVVLGEFSLAPLITLGAVLYAPLVVCSVVRGQGGNGGALCAGTRRAGPREILSRSWK